jgi:hypothetical protein
MKISFAFDVGHSSIGWSVLTIPPEQKTAPDILGCGTVLFEKDSALANQRRLHRSQRRHVRATRQRIARLEKLLIHLGALSPEILTAKHAAAGGHSAPWFLAAKVFASADTHILSWPEMWDVLRWYAHNRGYDPLAADTNADPKDTEKVVHAKTAMHDFKKHTMAETICAWLRLDPLGDQIASTENYKGKDAAFERATVRAEVRRLLTAHIGKLTGIDDHFITALLDNAHALPCPGIILPKRYAGGLLFGRLAMRYHNRIIGQCPLSGEKLPLKDCPEFFRFRWAMLLANITVAGSADSELRQLTRDERIILTRDAVAKGYFTPGEFRKAVRALTGSVRDNLDQMFMDATAAENLVVDPSLRLANSNTIVSPLWPHLPEKTRLHALNRWRKGRAQTLATLRTEAVASGHDITAFDAALDAICTAPAKKGRKKEILPPTREDVLTRPFSCQRLGGRAPFARPLLIKAYDEVMLGLHPRMEGNSLFEKPEQRRARETRSIDQQTNNHLVRHRLMILGRLVEQLVADPAYGADDPARVARLVLEVNRDLREMSGLTAQDIAKEMGKKLADHKNVAAYLEEKLPPGTPITYGLIRKARIAHDLNWTCPYTGQVFDPRDLLYKQVDKDHIIPRSLRPTDAMEALVITFSEINRWKNQRTARQFVEDEAGKAVPGKPNLHIVTPARFEKMALDHAPKGDPVKLARARGERVDDDALRCWRRKDQLLLQTYHEKAGGFTPGHLTQTSQLSRLGQQVLRKPFDQLAEPPTFVALPGQLTARARAAWDVMGCLSEAAPDVLEIQTDTEGKTHRTVKTKTEIRKITHLHHALDACVLGLAADRFPRRGDIWRALIERRPSNAQRLELETLDLGDFEKSGGFRLRDLPEVLKVQLRQRLAERRVVQHVPADMSGFRAKQNTRGILDDSDPELLTLKPGIGDDGTKQKKPEKVLRTKVIGLQPGKLNKLKGVQVIAANYGIAILDHPSVPETERINVIRFYRVWQRLQELTKLNGGKRPRIIRNGTLIHVPRGNRQGLWKVTSTKETEAYGIALDLTDPAGLELAKGNAPVIKLVQDGIEILKAKLTGITAS